VTTTLLAETQLTEAVQYNDRRFSLPESERHLAVFVAEFQASQGITVDGKLGPRTLELLGKLNPKPPAPAPTIEAWADGWLSSARREEIHSSRIGGPIKPWGVVVHTTDMVPNSFGALIKAWQASAGKGNGAHFLIGRDESQGVVQLAPVDRNGNHAGGPAHGWFTVAGRQIHPNSVTVGIEVHNAGKLRLVEGQWRNDAGKVFDPDNVSPDPLRGDVGWHTPTPYQLEKLDALLRALASQLAPAPPAGLVPNGVSPAWSAPPSGALVGHVTLDPNRKTDPGPAIMAWLRARTA